MKARFLWRAFKARYRDQRAEIGSLIDALGPSDIAVDVGANKGSHILWLSRAVPHGRVVAFEPQPALADYLCRAVCALNLKNVTIEPAAVSDRAGKMILHIPGAGDSPGASLERAVASCETCRDVEVPVVTLDEYFKDTEARVAAIKIDVEGHELSVFRGAGEILSKHSPILVFECENRHISNGSVFTVLDYLRSLGYDGSFVYRGKLIPISVFDPAIHQRQVGERFWDRKDYCNNFIMRKKGFVVGSSEFVVFR
jgi:FkbM family methyltransferase